MTIGKVPPPSSPVPHGRVTQSAPQAPAPTVQQPAPPQAPPRTQAPKTPQRLLRQQQLTSPAKQKALSTVIAQRGVVRTGPQPQLNLIARHESGPGKARPQDETEAPEREQEDLPKSKESSETRETRESTPRSESPSTPETQAQQERRQEPLVQERPQQEPQDRDGGRGRQQRGQQGQQGQTESDTEDSQQRRPERVASGGQTRGWTAARPIPRPTPQVGAINPNHHNDDQTPGRQGGRVLAGTRGQIMAADQPTGLESDTRALGTRWARTELAPLDALVGEVTSRAQLKPQQVARLIGEHIASLPSGSEILAGLILRSPSQQRQEVARAMALNIPELQVACVGQMRANQRAEEIYHLLEAQFAQAAVHPISTPEYKAARETILALGKEFNAITKQAINFAHKSGVAPGMLPEPGGFLELLPPDKQQLVEAVVSGVAAARFPNRVTASQTQQVQLDAERTVSIDMPTTMTLHGRSYGLVKKLGAGADGVAFLMRELGRDGKPLPNGRQIVAKAMVDPSLESNRRNMINEVLAHQHVMGPKGTGHAAVLRLEGLVRHGDNFLVVSEFAGGGDMRRVFARIQQSDLPPQQKQLLGRLLMRDVMQGMQYLEEVRGVGHYDMKPENVFVRANGMAMVADMGRANMDLAPTRAEGTKPYLAPERHPDYGQIRLPDYKADIYTLGLMLYEAVEGRHPRFKGKDEKGEIVLSDAQWSGFRAQGPNRQVLTEEDHLLNAMLREDPSQRPNLSAVLASPYFKDTALDEPGLRQTLARIIT